MNGDLIIRGEIVDYTPQEHEVLQMIVHPCNWILYNEYLMTSKFNAKIINNDAKTEYCFCHSSVCFWPTKQT